MRKMIKATQRNKAILSTTRKMDSFDNAKDDKGNPKGQGDSFDNTKDDKGNPKEQGDSFDNAKDGFFRQRER